MSERIMTVIVGDWSDDGHGKTSTYTYKLEGADVSDETIKKNFEESCEKIGTNFLDFCAEYQDSNMPGDVFNKLEKHDINTDYVKGDKEIYFSSSDFDDGKQRHACLSSILALYLDMKVTVVPAPALLLGGYDGLLRSSNDDSSFGYGFYY